MPNLCTIRKWHSASSNCPVVTGCDHNSGFYGTSKKVVSDRIKKCKEARDLLASCGDELHASNAVLGDLEKFVLRYVYCDMGTPLLLKFEQLNGKHRRKAPLDFLLTRTVFSFT